MRISKTMAQAVVVGAGLLLIGAGCPTQPSVSLQTDAQVESQTKGSVMVQDRDDEERPVVYLMKDGKMMMGLENSEAGMMKEDAVLSDGSRVTMDGKLITKEGNVIMLKEGEKVEMDDGTAVIEASGETSGIARVDIAPDMDETASAISAGSYEPYLPASLALANKEKVVLFFAASWCPTCQAADANFKQSAIPAGVHVLKVDYDTSTELKKKYVVTYQHTFVQVDAEGKLLEKWSGSTTADEIAKQIQ